MASITGTEAAPGLVDMVTVVASRGECSINPVTWVQKTVVYNHLVTRSTADGFSF